MFVGIFVPRKSTVWTLNFVGEWTVLKAQWGDGRRIWRKDTNEVLLQQKVYCIYTQYTTGTYNMQNKRVQRFWSGEVADKYTCGNFAVYLFLGTCWGPVARFVVIVAFVCSQALSGGLAAESSLSGVCTMRSLQELLVWVVKEIKYETSHLLPLKHRLISACVIGQEPLSATNQSTQDIRH